MLQNSVSDMCSGNSTSFEIRVFSRDDIRCSVQVTIRLVLRYDIPGMYQYMNPGQILSEVNMSEKCERGDNPTIFSPYFLFLPRWDKGVKIGMPEIGFGGQVRFLKLATIANITFVVVCHHHGRCPHFHFS